MSNVNSLNGKALLMRYLKEALAEVQQARVPQQLLSPDNGTEEEDGEEAEAVQEFSGAGCAAGYTAPLGSKRHRKS